MARGNFADGDYFIDCDGISQSALRAIFGVWINVCVAVIAICIRSIFRDQVRRSLVSGKGNVSVWRVSPAVTTSEVFELRSVLSRALVKGDFFFVFASVFCIVTALIGAASTVISNYVVVSNNIVRNTVVQGRLVTREHATLSGALVQVSKRTDALNAANAPMTELFDFTPEDDSQWLYDKSQWNNTWTATCSFAKHEAVDLVVFPTKSTQYQDEIPLLGKYMPTWATLDPAKQGNIYTGFYGNVLVNGTGAWRDLLVTYVFGSAPDNTPGFTSKTSNISIVNYLGHSIGRDPNTTYLQTAFKSDVHVVDCAFVNAVDASFADQSNAAGGHYANAAGNVANMYNRAVVEASIAEKPVTQPTGQQMLRYWQAFMSVKDAQYPHPQKRTLAVRRQVVQMRLSALVTTIGAFLLAILAAGFSKIMERRNGASKIRLPSSQLDWIVEAAREHTRYYPKSASPNPEPATRDRSLRSPARFASNNPDISFVMTPDREPRIATVSDIAAHPPMQQMPMPTPHEHTPQLAHYDPWAAFTQTDGSQSPTKGY